MLKQRSGPIDEDGGSVIDDHFQHEVGHVCRVRHIKGFPEVGRYELVVCSGAIANSGRFICIAVAELREAVFPGHVVEVREAPIRALVRAVIEVFPSRAGRDE